MERPSAADRAMPGPNELPEVVGAGTSRSPAMRRLLASNWFRNVPPAAGAAMAAMAVSPAALERAAESERLRRHEAVVVATLPKCDLCNHDARYDGKMRGISSWAYMCDGHFESHGVGLGLGVGQELIVRQDT